MAPVTPGQASVHANRDRGYRGAVPFCYRAERISQPEVVAEVRLLEFGRALAPVVRREPRDTIGVKIVGQQSDCIGL